MKYKAYTSIANVGKAPARELAHIRNRSIGFIFQSYFLLPRLTLLENVGLPLIYRNCTDEQIQEDTYLALQRVGMANLGHRFPVEVSGGQLQRIAIARALVGHPSVILADEPTSALHATVAQEIMDLFVQLNTLDKNTIIIITHDEEIAAQCQRSINIQDGLILP